MFHRTIQHLHAEILIKKKKQKTTDSEEDTKDPWTKQMCHGDTATLQAPSRQQALGLQPDQVQQLNVKVP